MSKAETITAVETTAAGEAPVTQEQEQEQPPEKRSFSLQGFAFLVMVRVLTRVLGLFARRNFTYSRNVEGSGEHPAKGDGVYLCYKIFYRALAKAEQGCGIEEHFARQPRRAVRPGEDVQISARATLSFMGDLLPTRDVTLANTAHALDDVEGFYSNANLVCANLEAPIVATRPPWTLPPQNWLKPLCLNHNAQLTRWLLGCGIDLVSTANNHALDQGAEGVTQTLDFLDKLGCAHVGTARSAEEQKTPRVFDLGGMRVGFVSWTYSLNDKPVPEGKDFLANVLRLNLRDVDLEPLRQNVQATREAGADIVVALLHWGLEFEYYPNSTIINNAHRVIELGVDVIVGNHPHHPQPWEWYKGGLIFYALNDFLAWQREKSPESVLGILTRIEVCKGVDAQGHELSWVDGFELMPTFPFAVYEHGICTEFRMLDLGRLAREDFAPNLPGFLPRHARLACRLWHLAQTLRLTGEVCDEA
jgi:poly-gamma-glutamate synthesis protein (capsule biosynthesis protein)